MESVGTDSGDGGTPEVTRPKLKSDAFYMMNNLRQEKSLCDREGRKDKSRPISSDKTDMPQIRKPTRYGGGAPVGAERR
jgi:hypothetical protein